MQTNIKREKVSLITLGCKVSKYETDCMAQILNNAGYEVTFKREFADIYIINTCAVTNEAEKKSRQHVSKLLNLNKNAKIIICGCASENNLEQFNRPNVISVIGNEGKEDILNLISNPKAYKFSLDTQFNNNLNSPYKSKTRAYIKVQDGCNNFCSYCIIPYVRGRSRSRDINDIINEANELSKDNSEIVIIGIDLSSFSIDNKPALAYLIYRLKNLNARTRLGSLEVNVITDEFLNCLKDVDNFCPHFHLSLQSGSNTVLKRMNRHYTTQQFLQKIDLIRSVFPTANITTDIIVGFVGETDQEFNETVDTCIKARFGNIHIFPYSKREGTNAYLLDAPVKSIVRNRIKKLEQVRDDLSKSYYNSMINQVSDMLIEDVEDDFYVGYTQNYIKVYLKENNLVNGKIVKVKLLKPFKNGMLCELIK